MVKQEKNSENLEELEQIIKKQKQLLKRERSDLLVLSFSSFLAASVLGSIMILVLIILLKLKIPFTGTGLNILLIFSFCIVLRLLIPLEFSFTHTINSRIILTRIYTYLFDTQFPSHTKEPYICTKYYVPYGYWEAFFC